MRILILGAGGFIGTNLAIACAQKDSNEVIAYDIKNEYLDNIRKKCGDNVSYLVGTFESTTDFDAILKDIDLVYHLFSNNIPGNSNKNIELDIQANVMVTIKLLEACVRNNVQKVSFISSGGAVYGKEHQMPLKEDTPTNPITSYGIQKMTIEKLLYVYDYIYGLDYRIIRLANPYGPYQRPNSDLGILTKFVYYALNDKLATVYGDGSIIRDYIYIEDAIKAVINITDGEGIDDDGVQHKIFNVGSGKGTSINDIIKCIEATLKTDLRIQYRQARETDVPINYLDISLYESIFGKLIHNTLEEGIIKTKIFLEGK